LKRFLITPLIFSITLILFCSAARADLCLLKSDASYTTGTPCADADAADGTTDGIINLTIPNTEATLETMVVFDFNGATQDFDGIDQVTHKLYFSPNASLSDAPACEGTACTKPSCTMPEVRSTGSGFDYQDGADCAKKYNSGAGDFPSGIYIYLSAIAMSTSAMKTNFRVSTISFKNGGAKDNVYTFKFDPTDAPDEMTPTDIKSFGCSTFQTGGCPPNLPQQQKMYETRITVTGVTITCTTTKPGNPTLSCKGTPGTPSPGTGLCTPGTPAVGEAAATLDYTLPSSCTKSDGSACTVDSTKSRIKFTSAGLGETDKILTGPSPYTKYIDVNTNIAAFTAKARVSTTDGLDCSESDDLNITGVSCSCGKIPLVACEPLTNKACYKNQPLSIKFTLSDLDDSLLVSPGGALKPTAIPNNGIVFYYVVGEGASSITQISNVRETLNLSDYTFTATIPGDKIVPDETIYFGVVVTTEGGTLTGRYPSSFRTDTVSNFITDTNDAGAKITNCKQGTSFDFAVDSTGQKQYPRPDRFPFHAGNDVLRMYFELNNSAIVSAQIYSLDGTLVRHLDYSTSKLSDCNNDQSDLCNMCTTTLDDNNRYGCIWDGTTYEGGSRWVANGLYIVNIHAVCTGDPFKGSTLDHTKGIVVIK